MLRCFSWILPHQGDNHAFDGFVESNRVGNAIVESFAIAESVLDEVVESCFGGDLDAELFHLVKQRIECFAILQPPVGGELPRLRTDGAVGLFEKRSHLGQGALLVAIRDCHGPNGLLILLLELGQLGLAGNVCLAKQIAAVGERTIKDEIAALRQLRTIRRVEVALANRVLDRLQFRFDVPHEFQIGRLALGVVGLAGHRDIAFDSFLANNCVQFAGRHHPPLEINGRVDWLRHQLLIPGFDLIPRFELEFLGKPLVRKGLGSVAIQGGSPGLPSWQRSRLCDFRLRNRDLRAKDLIDRRLGQGIEAWTSQAPAKSQDDMIAVAMIKTRVVVATASTCAKSPLASPSAADGLE